MVPANGDEMIVALAAVVVHVRRPQVTGERLDRLAEVAHQVRVAVVETDADVEPVQLFLDEPRARRARQRIGDHLERHAHVRRAAARDLLDAAPRGVRLIVVGAHAARVGMPRCDTRKRTECVARARAPPAFPRMRALRRPRPRTRSRTAPTHLPFAALDDRRVHRVQLETRVGEPLGERSRSPGSS